jgi:hypothetical protein
MTSNQYYKGINNRFDKRVARIHRMGFKRITNEFGSFYVRGIIRSNGKNQIIPAALLGAADNRLWYERLQQILRC